MTRFLSAVFTAWVPLLATVVMSTTAVTADEKPRPAAEAVRALDLIPADACGAIAINNLQRLRAKADAFVKQTGVPSPQTPSQLLEFVYMWLGVRNGLDEDAAGAVMILSYPQAEQSWVIVVPFKDAKAMAGNFGLSAEEFRPGKVLKRNPDDKTGNWFRDRTSHLLVKGKHVFVGQNEASVKRAAAARKLRAELSERQQQALDTSEAIGHISTKGWGDGWQQAVKEIDRAFDVPRDEPEAEALAALRSAIKTLRIAVFGLRIDDGLGLSMLALLGKDEATTKTLTALSGGPRTSGIHGLPTGHVLFAQGTGGGALRKGVFAKALLERLLRGIYPVKELVTAARRPNFVGVFGDVWLHLQGSRVAAYRNVGKEDRGVLSLLAILDSDDPEKFLGEMRSLTTFINNAGQKLGDGKTAGIDPGTVRQLIRELGADDFRVRQSATTKLGLIGPAALPLLEEALKSDDAEVVARARRLRARIQAVALAGAKDPLAEDLLGRLRPKFVYFPAVEKRAGVSIDVVDIRLTGKDAQFVKQLQDLLGPEWNKIRLARHSKQIVVLLGSRTELLETTIANLKEKKPGMAALTAVKSFERYGDPERRIQMHVSLSRVAGMLMRPTGQPVPAGPEGAVSSVSLAIAPGRVQLDTFVPAEEFARLVRLQMR